jgi:hypothetical protein
MHVPPRCPQSTRIAEFHLSAHYLSMYRTVATLALIQLLCLSCSEPAVDASKSLVGAKKLPPASELSQEIIYIGRGGTAYGGAALSYEWTPDNVLTVTHSFAPYDGSAEAIRGQETLTVPPEAAVAARELLRRVHPERLEHRLKFLDREYRPTGCERTGPHDWGETRITFHNQGRAPGIEDDTLAVFALPTTANCNTHAAEEAREVVSKLLRTLPRSEVAAGFEESN